MSKDKKEWRPVAIDVAANPHHYTKGQRFLAWCYLYESKTGKPVRQITLPPYRGAVPDKEEKK